MIAGNSLSRLSSWSEKHVMLAALRWLLFLTQVSTTVGLEYVCPNSFRAGIPLEIYGSDLFRVAIPSKDKKTYIEPFWATLGGYIRESLQGSVAKRQENENCTMRNDTTCRESMNVAFTKALERTISWTHDWLKGHYFNYKARPSDYGPNVDIPSGRTIVLSCLYWCHTMLKMPRDERKMMAELCPNPCHNTSLCSGVGTEPGSCEMTQEGFFDFQYSCRCKKNYEWDPVSMSCLLHDPCKRQPPICDPDGTITCTFDWQNNEHMCVCKPEYTGDDCRKTANACEERIQHAAMPNGGLPVAGNRSCNVNNDGNRCIAYIDPKRGPMYDCICNAEKWIADSNLPYDNCLRRVSKCDQMTCVRGQCYDSRDGQEAENVCEDGYGGENCNVWVGLWSNWSPWSKCIPACGRERWAIRSRKCLVQSKIANPERLDCNGSALEYSACEPRPCARAKEDILLEYFGVREQTLMMTFVLAAVSGSALALIWKLGFAGAIGRRFRRLLINPRRR